MTLLLPILLPVGVFLSARWLTGQFRRYALARGLFDVPNARSSHAVATPRVGGLAIVLPTLISLPLLAALGALRWPAVWALLGGGGLVALVGLVDDHRPIARRWRLLSHLVAAGWALAWLGGLPPISLLGLVTDFGWVGYALA